ncbi:MAG: hypothetical protein KZQ89_02920 [Candidatus Thiodiazotropha sp. (ex Lucinoma kastoroae)]|nr:hypothetical protein [Candidatus Thiodiazotropha sp. (ex Lucinoma kastoroae)]
MNKPEFISSKEICKIMDFHKRTLHRRLLCPVNPLPQPAIKRIGGVSLWDTQSFYDWVERERERTLLEFSNKEKENGDE